MAYRQEANDMDKIKTARERGQARSAGAWRSDAVKPATRKEEIRAAKRVAKLERAITIADNADLANATVKRKMVDPEQATPRSQLSGGDVDSLPTRGMDVHTVSAHAHAATQLAVRNDHPSAHRAARDLHLAAAKMHDAKRTEPDADDR